MPVPYCSSGTMLPIPATSRTICIGSRYWRTNARQRGSGVASANLFGPWRSRRAAASAAVSPCAGSTSSAAATSSAGRANHERSGVAAASAIASRGEARTRG